MTLTMLRILFQMTIKTESVSVQLMLFNAKLLYIASFYRPAASRIESLALIHSDIGNAMKK